ncbi:MAG: gamma-glutamyltransferase family protein [Actinomycetota bacterium]|nr:gamma-glutamyltransferase family protein [Actinomycetota bacterium]
MSALAAVLLALLPLPAQAGTAAAQAHPGAVKEPVAVGTGGAVASMDTDATQAGIDVLKHGGNAIDAAVATASTLGVTIPFVAGPGGGGFMVIYLARTHQVVTIDGRETCPRACTPTMFTDPKTGQPLGYDYASDQPLATGVPSMVATWAKAVSSYGSKSLAADLQPAIRVAGHGFRVNPDFVQLTKSDLPELRAYPASRSLLLTPAGNPLPVGYLLRNLDLAKTYRLLARYGPSYLYDGPLGRAIVAADDFPVVTPGNTVVALPGIMTTSDLSAYQARVQAPTHVRYRGLDIYSMAPPSSSGSTVGEALNILSGYDLAAEPRATALFHYLEASRLAYADRNAYVGDPRYVSVPLSGLLSPAFAATRRCLIGNQALVSPVAPGDPYPPYPRCQSQSPPQAAASSEGLHTNNIVTTDKWGDIVAYTNTINFFGGSGETVPGYGFLLNNEMTDFDFAPSSAGGYDPNLPAGGKQPRSSMGPVIAFRDGTPVFSVGAAGGSTIITTILQIILNHVDFGMTLPAALAAPRVSQTNSATSLAEPAFYHSALARQLTSQFGEKFTEATGPVLPLDYYPGDATALQLFGHGRVEAIAEPVRLGGGSALVVNPARGRFMRPRGTRAAARG